MPAHVIRTDRLLLRRWRPSDLEPFAAMNADPRVMQYFPALFSREESDAMAARAESLFERHGFGFWAVEAPGIAPFIGLLGLSIPRFEAHFMPAVEIGWRIAAEHWNRGYATEGARAALAFGFETLRLEEVVAFTVPSNVPSRRVMEKLGMTRNKDDDFDHPLVPAGHPLRRHVLYRINATTWAGHHPELTTDEH
jgi:RimJ/RimL family protein N-acetyltransferase